MALGVTVQSRTAPPARGAPTSTGTAFVTGRSDTFPADDPYTRVTSMAEFTAAFGIRATHNALLYDWVDVFLREGGRVVYVSSYAAAESFTVGLGKFPKQLGPGQVSAIGLGAAPGAVTWAGLDDHAEQNNRIAVRDVEQGDTVAEMVTMGGLHPETNNTHGFTVGPWVEAPGPAGVIGAGAREVPGSAAAAALCARVDALGNPNRAAAGRDFPLQYVTGFTVEVTEDERETLLNAGINPFCDVYGVLELYGFQTAMEQNEENPFWQANCSRARMWAIANAKAIGENYMFKPIDGRGRLARGLQTDIEALLLALYQVDGLYGETPADAFAVEVGAAVNTETSVAQGELRASAELRFSLHAKAIIIDLVSVPVTGRISSAT